ncbi:hypothetical protein A4H97_16995 [Niastella yeongjuensis]|uniref:Uncharacterized protein n=1 Tax=Niastella yeongjuensis TaxID=354355 RepID=A0A1V9E1Z2_9BACT|nr:hypothetical protein [Niastella yeongjuensis]OQP39915.1 hypothetical protein A4H97_16995 [Niastella yeongjuensis]SEO10045.1 hypothetical protein SAMN05660816_02144 [Niastella yeongjuensis]
MKIKIICLLTVLLIGAGMASSNNYCGGVRNPGKLVKQATVTPVKKVAMMIDDMELLPTHHFLNTF